jgi:hypothetical protein
MNRWDPISLYKQMSGNDRVFIVYLVLIFVFSLVRSLRLGWKLWLFSPANRVSSDQPKPDASDLLAAIALANKLPNNDKTTEEPWQVVESARPRVEYLWEQSVTRVAAMKDFCVLTLILSGLVLSCDLMRFLTEIQSGRYPVHGDIDVAGGPAEMLVPLVLGFAVAAVLYALSSLYAGALARRKAAWNLFAANAGSQHRAE